MPPRKKRTGILQATVDKTVPTKSNIQFMRQCARFAIRAIKDKAAPSLRELLVETSLTFSSSHYVDRGRGITLSIRESLSQIANISSITTPHCPYSLHHSSYPTHPPNSPPSPLVCPTNQNHLARSPSYADLQASKYHIIPSAIYLTGPLQNPELRNRFLTR